MFDALRNLIADLTTADPGRAEAFGETDYRLAAAALLFHIADVDGDVSDAERRRLKTIVAEAFGLDGADSARLVAAAEKSEHEAVDLYQFTSVLKRALDADGRLKIIELLWEMALADGTIHEFEDNAVWRVAELLGISTRDRVRLRQKVAGGEKAMAETFEAELDADRESETASGPWSPKPGA